MNEGFLAVVLLAGGVVAAFFLGKKNQLSADKAAHAVSKRAGAEAALKAAGEVHEDAVQNMDAKQLTRHRNSLREQLRELRERSRG